MNMHEHLLDRNFDVTKYPGVAVTEETVTFPLWNLSGQMVGFQCYNPSQPKHEVGDPRLQKYFSWVTKPTASKNAELAVWGLETVHWADRVLFLTEGVFDACRLHMFGLPAVAVMSNNPAHLTGWLMGLPSTKVACVQGDKAGKALAKYGDRCVMLPDGKDVGDLDNREFLRLFEEWLR
jgi:hypothetical protein